MDSSGFSQIGRYGTLALMKTHEPDTVVTAFGIDTEELTFGRDSTCGVRLYYPDIDPVHCKIVFEERKAFLVILGESGLLVDDCKVFPSSSSSPTTIPLMNNSEVMIHGKRFKFAYPPKELRGTLLATPARPSHRALRLSMIHSALVFSPRPSHDPRENLRILKSPLKGAFKSPMKCGSPIPARTTLFGSPSEKLQGDEEEEEEAIILVDGNHPRVVEEEKDLVILEDVPVSQVATNDHLAPQPFLYSPQPQTPVRSRSVPRNSLHRAVLIRSAQRAVIKAEREREEHEEEMEVLETVASELEECDDDEEEPEGPDEVNEGTLGEEEDEDCDNSSTPKLTWQKSIERLWPFRSSSPHDENEEEEEQQAQEQEENENENENEDVAAPLPNLLPQTPVRRPLGSFMTPQVVASHDHLHQPRYSVGGVEARRVPRPEQVWRVRDIVLPSAQVQTPRPPIIASPVRSTRKVVDDAERKAIRERRRSAFKEADSFFPGGVPGMGASPAKASSSSNVSPVKIQSPAKPAAEIKRESEPDETEVVDTRSLLERMKGTVEEVKRRRSLAPAATPVRKNLEALMTPARGSGQKLDFGSATNFDPGMSEESDEEKENGVSQAQKVDVDEISMEDRYKEEIRKLEKLEEPLFSLLRPGVLEESKAQKDKISELTLVAGEEGTAPAEIEEDVQADEDDPQETTNVTKPPPRRTRATGRTKIFQDDTAQQSRGTTLPAAKPPSRRGRKATVEPEEPPMAVPAPTARGRKPAAAEPELPLLTTAPSRRGRKPIAEVELASETADPTPPIKRGRKPTPPSIVKSEDSDETTTTAPVRRGRPPKAAAASQASGTAVKRGVKTKPIEVEAGADPLDTSEVEDAPKVKGGRKKVVKVEVLEDDVEEVALPVVTKIPRGRSGAVKTPVIPAAKARSTRRTPATAPAAVTGTGALSRDKENTPGSDASSNNADSGEEMVKVRVSRTTRTTKAASGIAVKHVKVKEEEELPGEMQAPKGRVMRVTRARTRT